MPTVAIATMPAIRRMSFLQVCLRPACFGGRGWPFKGCCFDEASGLSRWFLFNLTAAAIILYDQSDRDHKTGRLINRFGCERDGSAPGSQLSGIAGSAGATRPTHQARQETPSG